MLKKSQFEKTLILILGIMLGIVFTSTAINHRFSVLESSLNEMTIAAEEDNSTIIALNERIKQLEAKDALGECSLFYGEISPEQAQKLLEEPTPPTLIDLRSEAEYNESHISGALNIPMNQLQERLDGLDTGSKYILYCKSGIRSRQALMIMEQRGFLKTYAIIGGIDGWKDVGQPVSTRCPCEEE
jgi:rhodanese-related sulfurtransferase